MVRYEVVECSSALTRVQGMPFHWSLNPYRGCVHGCHYCYARRYHGFLELDAGEDFASVIFVKGNLPQVLRRELRRPGWARETVALGTGTDPYQAIEGRFCLTRDSLRALADYGTPASIVTKGTLILRDLVELCRLQEAASVVLCFSLTSLRPEVWRRLEPGAPPPHQRLKVLAKLVDAGIQAGVFLAPILPGFNDEPADLERVARAAAEHGAAFLGSQILHLQPGTREHFLGLLKSEYPELLDRYHRLFPGAYPPKRYQDQVGAAVRDLRREYGLPRSANPVDRSRRQLTLPLA